MVQEIRLRSDYREIILLEKEVGEGQQTLCGCHCHAEGDRRGTEALLRIPGEGSGV